MIKGIYVWGCSDSGQLGVCNDPLIRTPRPMTCSSALSMESDQDASSSKIRVVQVACGYRHTLFLTDTGSVLSFGSNEYGQLGRTGSNSTPLPVNGLPGYSKVILIASGWQHCGAVTESGHLFMWGLNTSGQCGHNDTGNSNGAVPVSVPLREGEIGKISSNVVQIACGRKHTLALLKDSRLLSWGLNNDGQLGLGAGVKYKKDFNRPQYITALANLPIRLISCGADHSVAVTPTGNIYVWGSNDCGQLGVEQRIQRQTSSSIQTNNENTNNRISSAGSAASEPVPVLLRRLKGITTVHVACGESHTVVLTNNGRVFTFGSGRMGQLGNGTFESRATPAIVQDLLGNEVTQIACGRAHTVAFVGSTGKLYAFGNGERGQLGGCAPANNENNVSLSASVKLVHGAWSKRGSPVSESKSAEVVFITQIFAGGDHNFVLSTAKKNKQSICDMRVWNPVNSPFSIALMHTDQSKLILGDPSQLKQAEKDLFAVVLSSHACLSASFYDTKELGNPPPLSRRFHCVDLEVAQNFQTLIWDQSKSNEPLFQTIHCQLYDNILRNATPNFPDVECLRAFLILALSPLFTEVQLWNKFHLPFCISVNKLAPVPQSVLDDWLTTFKPRYLKRMVLPLIQILTTILNENKKQRISPSLESTLKPLLDFLLKLYEINRQMNQCIPVSSFKIPDLHSLIELERDFMHWLQCNRTSTRSYFQRSQSPGAVDGQGKSRQPRSRNISESVQLAAPASSNALRSGSVGTNQNPPLHTVRAVQENSAFFFCNYPFLFDGEAKTVLLRAEAILSMQSAMNSCVNLQPLSIIAGLFNMPMPDFMPFFQITVRRDFLIEDTLTVLASADRKQLRKPLTIQFKGEDAVDEGGLRKEFFMLIIREIFNPLYGMFRFYPESRLFWFNEMTLENSVMYGLIGQLCGLAIYNNLMVDLPFPLALFKKLMNIEPTLDDLKELDPIMGKSLQDILDYEADDLEDVFSLTFELSFSNFDQLVRVPLCSNGEHVMVTQENKAQFVHLYIDYVFNRGCQSLYEDFHRGFHYIIQGADTSLQLFTPEELQALVVGNEDYNWASLRGSAEYQGEFWDRHDVIQWFWDIFLNDFHEKEKKKFLRFLTGCDRVPISGMNAIKIRFQPTRGGDQFFPVAHTCYNLLDLPIYSSKNILRDRLLLAIEHTEGFTIV